MEGVKYGLKCSFCKIIEEKLYFYVPNLLNFFIFKYLCEKVPFLDNFCAKNGNREFIIRHSRVWETIPIPVYICYLWINKSIYRRRRHKIERFYLFHVFFYYKRNSVFWVRPEFLSTKYLDKAHFFYIKV